MPTVAEQILKQKAETVLERLTLAQGRGDPIEVAQAKVAAARIQAELAKVTASSGASALASMAGGVVAF
jgi:hypothetical protein